MSSSAMSKNPEKISYELSLLIKNYLKFEQILSHRKHIQQLIDQNDTRTLENLLTKRLTFGTAGIRGPMGPGFGQMNDLVIIQTSQGLASYLLSLEPTNHIKDRGVLIGHDARHNSDRFARLACLAFLQKGIPVLFCEQIVPTPLIAFGVKRFACSAGIVVTASHNPKNDNGYKVYWSNGAQIQSPHDKNIQEHIIMESNQQPWAQAWNHELLLEEHLISERLPTSWGRLRRVYNDVSESYFGNIERLAKANNKWQASCCRPKDAGIRVTYTTMHGVGHTFLTKALQIAGFEGERIFPVECQMKPDPDFPTVKFPNPEEAGALDKAFETATITKSNLILANDPDADRCAAALYDPTIDYKRVLNGNEIGALLGWWIWHCHKQRLVFDSKGNNQPSTDKDDKLKPSSDADCYMISTAVSSKFLQTMSRIEGFTFVETLTGFKHMGNLADNLIKEHDKDVLFAYEEAIGYMVDPTVLDKDGISAAVMLAQCADYLLSVHGRTLEQQLDELYTLYGYHYNLNSYYICHEPSTIERIFRTVQLEYPVGFGSEFRVTRVRDLNTGYDSVHPDKPADLPASSSSYMLTLFVDEDMTFTIRTSGTEPKIKYYSEIVAQMPSSQNSAIRSQAKRAAQLKLRRLVEMAIEVCLKPSENLLEPASGQ